MSPDDENGEIQILPYNSTEEADVEVTPFYPDDDPMVTPLSESDEYGDDSDSGIVEV